MSDDQTRETATSTMQPPPAVPPSAPAGTATPEPGRSPRGHDGGGLFFGVVLILVGVAILVSRFLPGVDVWQLWPLLIIVPGAVQCVTPGAGGWSAHRFFDGLMTVGIGSLLLANTTGMLPWSVWWEVLRLWPVLLISAGLGILGRSTGQGWLRAMGTVVVLLAFLYAIAVTAAGTPRFAAGTGEPFTLTEPMAGVSSARLTLKSGAGSIEIDDTGGRTLEIEGASPFGTPELDATRSGATKDVEFSVTGSDGIVNVPLGTTTSVEAALPRQVQWDVTVESGASTLDADLSGLDVRRFHLKTGVADNTIRLGGAPTGERRGDVTVESGVSSVKVLVPRGVPARIESQSGLTGFNVPSPFVKTGTHEWETDNYDGARAAGHPVWVITIKSGVSAFSAGVY